MRSVRHNPTIRNDRVHNVKDSTERGQRLKCPPCCGMPRESMKMTDSENGGDSSDFTPFWELSILKKHLLNGVHCTFTRNILFQVNRSEGLNGVYRQLSNGLKINRKPSKKLFFSVNRQKCRARLTVKKFQSI